jgi:5-methylcytosine-specific restriction endonuclease McrA
MVKLRPIFEQYWGLPPDWHWRREQVRIKASSKCEICGISTEGRPDDDFHVHHIISKKLPEGNHSLENLQFLCEKCHSEQPSPGHNLIKGNVERKIRQRGYWKK